MNIPANSLIGASQFVGMFARGEISSEAFVRDLLSRSTEQANLNTFTWVNSDGALKAARAADRKLAIGEPIGALRRVNMLNHRQRRARAESTLYRPVKIQA